MTIQQNIPLAPLTTFKIGGPAKFFCEAGSEEEIIEALEFAREKSLSVFVLGGGSNVLVSDAGFGGLVIRINLDTWRFDLQKGGRTSLIFCGAGCQLSTIVRESIKSSFTGMEWAAGIPGKIGGSVWGNAGAYGGSMSDSVENVRCLEIPNNEQQNSNKAQNPRFEIQNKSEFQISNFKNKDCEFNYRDSIFKHNSNLIILSVKLNLKKGNREESEKKIKEILAKRREKQPAGFLSAGSFFKNPETDNENLIRQFETDTGKKAADHVSGYQYVGGKIKIPAPWLIEEVGLKGKKIGGAMVSEKHANFIVNTGNATAEEVITLAAVIKSRVRNKFGIQLQEEVQMVGF